MADKIFCRYKTQRDSSKAQSQLGYRVSVELGTEAALGITKDIGRKFLLKRITKHVKKTVMRYWMCGMI
jgi:hypothetical protein